MEKLVLDKIENIVEKEGNAGYQQFFSFPAMFSKRPLLQGPYKSGLCGKELKNTLQPKGQCGYYDASEYRSNH